MIEEEVCIPMSRILATKHMIVRSTSNNRLCFRTMHIQVIQQIPSADSFLGLELSLGLGLGLGLGSGLGLVRVRVAARNKGLG